MKKRVEPRYPAATVALYGPNASRATKVVVGIIKTASSDPDPMKKWVLETGDVRTDHRIQAEIDAFLKEHRVRQVVGPDRIIGCPHEEGIDYPEGEQCPQCAFWRNRDRFTHEIQQ
jgi:hypothetical protein